MTSYVAAQTEEWANYRHKYANTESLSGPGSTLEFTAPLRDWLPTIIAKHNIYSILDAPCGDGNWMSHVNLCGATYTGWDIVRPSRLNISSRFQQVNMLTVHEYPKVDLIICRDFLIHIPDGLVVLLLERMKASGSKYLCATNFPFDDNDIHYPYDADGFYYRPTNLQIEPFNLGEPKDICPEPGREPGREMALWQL